MKYKYLDKKNLLGWIVLDCVGLCWIFIYKIGLCWIFFSLILNCL